MRDCGSVLFAGTREALVERGKNCLPAGRVYQRWGRIDHADEGQRFIAQWCNGASRGFFNLYSLLGGDPRQSVRRSGVCMICANCAKAISGEMMAAISAVEGHRARRKR